MSGTGDATIVLVRHGQTTWVAEGRFQGSSDPPLSDLGERQAAAVARRLATPHDPPVLPLPPGAPRRIWHSPLGRAATTARAIWSAGGGQVRLIAEPGFAELAQGEWEGRTQAEVIARWPAELAAWRTDPVRAHAPGGEALPDGASRAARAVGRVLDDLASGLDGTPPSTRPVASPVPGYVDTSVGGPADANDPRAEPWSVVVAHDGILRLVLMHLLGLPLHHYWALPFGLCAISIVEIRSSRARLRAHNLSAHLPG